MQSDNGMEFLLVCLARSTALTSLDLTFEFVLLADCRQIADSKSSRLLSQQTLPALRHVRVTKMQINLMDLIMFVRAQARLQSMTMVDYFAVGLSSPDIDSWTSAIFSGAHASAMLKNVVGFEGLEYECVEGRQDIMLYKAL